ncbi:unnamed protein product, partial [Rotaria sordida]
LILVPSVAFRDHSSTSNSLSSDWILYVQGWYYEENPFHALRMEKTLEVIIQKDLYQNRIKMFTADDKKREDVCIDGLNQEMCIRTDDDGHINNIFTMTNQEI